MSPSPEHIKHIEKTTQGMMSAFEEISNLASDSVNAAMTSSAALSKGLGEIVRNANGLLQESATRALNVGKTIAGTKSMKEALDTHSEFMKDVFDFWVEGTSKISEISARMTQDAVAPITEHASNAMSKITEKAKAA